MVDWKNRIVETADMAVKDLKANPKNWRKHPQAQQNALSGALDAVGWVAPVIFNRQTGHLIDGHLRLELAVKRKEKTLPVSVVDLSPDEEAMILATFDPIAAMAEADRQMLAGLMQSIETEDEQVRALLESIAREEKIDLGGPPAEEIGIEPTSCYEVIVECAGEGQQEETYNALCEQGYRCRVLTL